MSPEPSATTAADAPTAASYFSVCIAPPTPDNAPSPDDMPYPPLESTTYPRYPEADVFPFSRVG